MTADLSKIALHYGHGSLRSAIEHALGQQGLSPDTVSVDDLGPVDEFHIGGRAATLHFMDQLGIAPGQHWLDIGCGLGGAARFVSSTYGASVTGIDLTEDYVETGRVLCDWVGLADRVTLQTGSALNLPFAEGGFDGAYMMHVGMNIADKSALFAEIARVLKPAAQFGIYDVMQSRDDALVFPVPWASGPDMSFVATPETYLEALAKAGFELQKQTDRHAFAMTFFEKMKADMAARGGPPPLGLHVLMQQSTAEKIPNMIANLAAGRIAPVEMLSVKTG